MKMCHICPHGQPTQLLRAFAEIGSREMGWQLEGDVRVKTAFSRHRGHNSEFVCCTVMWMGDVDGPQGRGDTDRSHICVRVWEVGLNVQRQEWAVNQSKGTFFRPSHCREGRDCGAGGRIPMVL